MSPLGSPSSSPPPFGRKSRSFARRCERCCCTVASVLPLVFVYSLTTWAVYVEARIGVSELPSGKQKSWTAETTSFLGVCLYILLNFSYTTAVFTDPGSPAHPRKSSSRSHKGYSHLPTAEPTPQQKLSNAITVSSTGAPRYCKKCSHSKPDRTHHCSSCRRCVLKMDHHCPWLATCVGLHNYKPFILFLMYTSLFCWVCFASSAYWVYSEMLSEDRYMEDFAPINIVLLSVISGIIGFVLSGFTGWHIWLSVRGITTIECLEKTRYLRGVRSRVERQRIEALHHQRHDSGPHGVQETLQRAGDAVLEFHANAVPGATRLEEGEERPSPSAQDRSTFPPHEPHQNPNSSLSPAQSSLARNYASHEADRERARYEDYVSETESSKLPNAFDLGWRRNLLHLLGPRWYYWFLPVTNTQGDGWRWEVSDRWSRAAEEQARVREARREDAAAEGQGQGRWRDEDSGQGYGHDHEYGHGYNHSFDGCLDHQSRSRSRQTGSPTGSASGSGSGVSMHTLKRSTPTKSKSKRQRRELDFGEAGEVDSFEVSSSNESGDEGEGGNGYGYGHR